MKDCVELFADFRNAVRNRLSGSLRGRWNRVTRPDWGRLVYSQEGEDALLCRIMEGASNSVGVYVDVGSNHPFRMSNTALLYNLGWNGISVDPNPEFEALYKQLRPRDTFVNCGIAAVAGSLEYHQFEESLFNTFDTAKAKLVAERHSRLLKRWKVPVRRLDEVLKEHWPDGKEIRFLSVDCEGLDLEVLQSHDFNSYSTDFICAEVHAETLIDAIETPIVTFLDTMGYGCISKLCNSCFFLRRDRFEKYQL